MRRRCATSSASREPEQAGLKRIRSARYSASPRVSLKEHSLRKSSGGETSPGCPPGYVVRGDAPGFYYNGPIYYAAPDWYHPWAFYGGRWVYRPYPYHTWYYNHYWRGHHHHY